MNSTPTLDTPEPDLYKARPRSTGDGLGRNGMGWRASAVAMWLVAVGWGWAGSAEAQRVHGVQLPDGSEKVGEDRYRSRRDFDGTLDYFKQTLPVGTYPRRSIVNQPGVKAVHIANPSRKKFEGINIYQANDEVRIYVIAAEPPKKAPPKKKTEKK